MSGHLSSRDRRTIDRIFQHPLCVNLNWRDVMHLFDSLKAEVQQNAHDKVKVTLNGVEHFFGGHHHGKSVNSRDELVELRHFLEQAGLKP